MDAQGFQEALEAFIEAEKKAEKAKPKAPKADKAPVRFFGDLSHFKLFVRIFLLIKSNYFIRRSGLKRSKKSKRPLLERRKSLPRHNPVYYLFQPEFTHFNIRFI